MNDSALLRPDEARVLRRAVGSIVQVELEVLHPDTLEHSLVVVARRGWRGTVARLLEDVVDGLQPDCSIERDLRLRDEGRITRRLRERCKPGGDDTLVVRPGGLTIVRAGVR